MRARCLFYQLNYATMAGVAGIEPATGRLTVACSTAELHSSIGCGTCCAPLFGIRVAKVMRHRLRGSAAGYRRRLPDLDGLAVTPARPCLDTAAAKKALTALTNEIGTSILAKRGGGNGC